MRAEQMLSSANAELRALQKAAHDTGGGSGGNGVAAGRDSAASREAADDQVTGIMVFGLSIIHLLRAV